MYSLPSFFSLTAQEWASKLKTIDENPIRLMNWILKEGVNIHEDIRFIHFDDLPQRQKMTIIEMFERLLQREPISKILSSKEFYGRMFKTTQDTLDPRADTEVLIEEIKIILQSQRQEINNSSIVNYMPISSSPLLLDLGTGTGCIIITALLEFKNAKGVAVDISTKALEVAKENAHKLGVSDRVEFIQSNWLDTVPHTSFDIILSNPPYIMESYPLSPSVLNFDPHLALFGGADGLDAYRLILSKLKLYCHKNTIIIFEMSEEIEIPLIRLAEIHGFQYKKTLYDLHPHPRALVFTL